MVRLAALLSLVAAAQAALASPIRARTPHAVKETHYVPRKWTQVGRAPESHVVHLHIGLKQGQFAELERHLYEGMHGPALQRARQEQQLTLLAMQSLAPTTAAMVSI